MQVVSNSFAEAEQAVMPTVVEEGPGPHSAADLCGTFRSQLSLDLRRHPGSEEGRS